MLESALSNAAAALVLAIIAALVGRLVRRPALTHGLWLLVLLKLLTPPLIRLPIHLPQDSPAASSEAAAPEQTEEIVIHLTGLERQTVDALSPTEESRVIADTAVEPAASSAPEPAPTTLELPGWPVLLACVWLTGSLAWLVLAGLRVRRMNCLLRFVQPAPEWLQAEVHVLAGRLGLRHVPSVWLVPGRISPMVWSLGGRPRLLLPEELLAALTAEQRAALLLHELAHLYRRDHWVRWLELAAMALYWWNPVVWWARHELREAEELCCDGWVVWAMPGAGRAYAAALIECLDFLSGVPRPLPVGASGLGHIHDLKRRLKMILNGTISRRLTWGGAAALAGLGVMLLPLVPAWSQDRKEEKPREERAQPERKPDSPEAQKARAEVEKLRAELEEQVKKVKAAEEKLRAAAAQLHKLEGKGGDVRILIIRDGDKPGGQRIEFERRIERPREGRPGEPGRGGDPGRREGGDRDRPMPPREGEGRPGPGGDRFQNLERKLEAIMRELEEMRHHMRQAGPRGPGGPGGPGAGPGGAGGGGGRPSGPGGPGGVPNERRPGPREEEESAAPRKPSRTGVPEEGKPRP